MAYRHVTVMLQEAVSYLNCSPGKIYVDATLGGAGHANLICSKIIPDGLLIGIDQDIDSIQNATNFLKAYERNVRLFHDSFVNLPRILEALNIPAVDGILLDLGISLHQIENSGRGFSFRKDEPLDMRMDRTSGVTAKDLINTLDEENLRQVFFKYGEERFARRIAQEIVRERRRLKINSSGQLAKIILDAVPKRAVVHQKIHPATRVFMALRIAVNNELEALESFMNNVADLLNPEGRLCVLSFHSLEDRIVKQRIKTLEKECTCPPDFPKCVCNKKRTVHVLTKKAKRASEEEIQANPMARSVRLRAIEKMA